jgi:hypothetical protein
LLLEREQCLLRACTSVNFLNVDALKDRVHTTLVKEAHVTQSIANVAGRAYFTVTVSIVCILRVASHFAGAWVVLSLDCSSSPEVVVSPQVFHKWINSFGKL